MDLKFKHCIMVYRKKRMAEQKLQKDLKKDMKKEGKKKDQDDQKPATSGKSTLETMLEQNKPGLEYCVIYI